ncbi:hypothetical protein [Sphingomonas sp. BE137]|uniref:hypothetical protein n=1 Tax=Sphingomonas sp. BE137 TaxID=2817844 RepID=UPI001AE70E22|nr:hypothetical protein [Sphingomonas sp. BE137]
MAQPAPITVADIIERCASDMHNVAFDFRENARSITFAEQRIAEVERICAVARRAVRG